MVAKKGTKSQTAAKKASTKQSKPKTTDDKKPRVTECDPDCGYARETNPVTVPVTVKGSNFREINGQKPTVYLGRNIVTNTTEVTYTCLTVTATIYASEAQEFTVKVTNGIAYPSDPNPDVTFKVKVREADPSPS